MWKPVLLTFGVTLCSLVLALVLMLKPLLGGLGLALTSTDKLRSLQSSQQIVERMRQRHQLKRQRVSRRLVKRSGRRVGSTLLAAATLGTVAVAVTMTSLEIADYCDTQRELQEEGNLLNQTTVEFDLERCLELGREDSMAILQEAGRTASVVVSEALKDSAALGSSQWAGIKQAAIEAIQSSSQAVDELWESLRHRLAQ